MSVNYTGVVGK